MAIIPLPGIDYATAFDLRSQKWILARSGSRIEPTGLRELFIRAHELTDIDSPAVPAASALWRILTVIAARVAGLDDMTLSPDEWHTRRTDLLTAQSGFGEDRVAAYFDRYGERFDLFHPERPFLQDPRLAEECGKSSGINKLVLSRPAGNNQPWFSHHSDLKTVPIPAREAVWHLLAQLFYGPSGRCTSRTVNGTSEANSTAGPLRSVISFHPLGRTIFESLIAGIPYPGALPKGDDLAPWERDSLLDPLALPPTPAGLAGALIGRTRHAVLLKRSGEDVSDAWITWAWRKPTSPAKDPYLVYQYSKTGSLYAKPADATRAIWRDVDALLLKNLGDQKSQLPMVFEDAVELPFDVLDNLRVRAFGFDQDGQTRDRQWFTAITPPVLSLLKDMAGARGLSRTREAAERAARHLRGALRNAWVAINDPSDGNGLPARKDIPAGPWLERGAARYWSQAEQIFWRKVFERDFDDPGLEFVQLALRAYDAVTSDAGNSPRLVRAVERARGYIFAARKPMATKEGS
ncbi:type I-E CRISPR-associated protein Cse1/CasA [Planomonospora venezuelensis]|uniref:CRISPR system Cascade subunit CasA n=1 Tax=Planomonospora venezuelensis TaxID=1999 RepID=A0A841D8U8_PLAVE|nr:type I-E CRISPR-associated protein Cse1/CasA [Planomonospora venezuelensis]MBB5965919.1 CRISPR system Cascade subunit CasA [Planomonospora venezuelensis]GIM98996.1 hypothetical protein Pve01_06550 [Planomonospora venezuelensis]